MSRRSAFSRRRFMQGAAAFGAASMLPAWSWAKLSGAGERLRIGAIGTGGMGSGHVRSLVDRHERDNLLVTHVCDVYRRRLDQNIEVIRAGGAPEGKGTMEYREVLDDKDVDAVLIATPDHWHTKIAIEAMEAGKDVYCEKPLSLTIEQAIQCRNAVKRTGRKLQVGPQGTSDGRFWAAREAIAAGRMGRITWSQAAYCRNSRGGQFNWTIDPDAGPAQDESAAGYVWWDRWLGHEWGLAEKIPWNADHFFRFRKYFAYNGGVATDLLYHRLAPLLLAISGHGGEYPSRVVASGGRYLEKDERDIPDTFFMMVDYPSEHTVVLASVMTNDTGVEDVIRGQFATMTFENQLVLREQQPWAKEFRSANADQAERFVQDVNGQRKDLDHGQAIARLEIPGRRDHMGNFLDAIRDGARLACDVDLGTSTMVAIKMGVEAYRQNKVMTWDAKKEQMVPA